MDSGAWYLNFHPQAASLAEQSVTGQTECHFHLPSYIAGNSSKRTFQVSIRAKTGWKVAHYTRFANPCYNTYYIVGLDEPFKRMLHLIFRDTVCILREKLLLGYSYSI